MASDFPHNFLPNAPIQARETEEEAGESGEKKIKIKIIDADPDGGSVQTRCDYWRLAVYVGANLVTEITVSGLVVCQCSTKTS